MPQTSRIFFDVRHERLTGDYIGTSRVQVRDLSRTQSAYDVLSDRIVVWGDVQMSDPITRPGPPVFSPLQETLQGIHDFAVDQVGSPIELESEVRRWAHGATYLSVTVRTPLETVDGALDLEEMVHDWMIENLDPYVRAFITVSVELPT